MLAGLIIGGPAQAAPAAIEAVWGFNGGEVAIVQQPDGSYAGIVDAPTTFASCPHAVGEEMWSDLSPRSDGSYSGLHQWFVESSAGCQRNPVLGPTAWRVMTAANGDRYLLVCFSQPLTTQPTISPSGATAAVTYKCYASTLLAAVPVQAPPASVNGRAAFSAAVSLPDPRRCFSRRDFKIHVHNPRYDPIRSAVVSIRGHRVAVSRHGDRFAATIDLRRFPRGTVIVRVLLTTVLGHRISGSRTYHTCVSRPLPKPTRRRRVVGHPGHR